MDIWLDKVSHFDCLLFMRKNPVPAVLNQRYTRGVPATSFTASPEASFLIFAKEIVMTEIKIYLFGSPHVEIQGRFMDLRLRKALALLAYLAATRKTHSRDTLAAMFWPEADQRTGRADLRRTVYNLKKRERLVGEKILEVTTESMGIHPDADLWTDVNAFEKNAGMRTDDTDEERLSRLSEAAQLYCGDFMAGFNLADCIEFDDWQFFQREHWQRMAMQTLDGLIAAHEAEGRFPDAISAARRRLSFDRLHEPTHRRLMQLYVQTGENAAAMRQYGMCKRMLKVELNAEPQAQTVDLYNTIRAERYAGRSTITAVTPKTRYAKSGDTYIAYQRLGSGPVDILFVSGFVSHIEYLWKEPGLASFFQRLAGFSRLIIFDRRGVGLSDRTGDPPHVESTLEDIHAVMKAAGSKRPILFGVSEGGPAILQYAHRYPQYCRGLILYGTMAKGTRSENYHYALTREQYDTWLAQLASEWGGPVGMDYFAPSRRHDPLLRQWWATLLRLSSSPGNVRLVLEALRDIDVRSLLPEIKVPSLILHRKDDSAIRVKAGRYMARHIPDSDYVELDGQDHWWWVGDMDPIIAQIKRFTQKTSGN
jgi:DNA-binding SARP family transcriptional activator/pimeloyl-ACP methyl ester carboxylesterase